jgi:hypothetical protein
VGAALDSLGKMKIREKPTIIQLTDDSLVIYSLAEKSVEKDATELIGFFIGSALLEDGYISFVALCRQKKIEHTVSVPITWLDEFTKCNMIKKKE